VARSQCYLNPMDRSSILIWNVRGLNDKTRRDNLRKVVDESRPAVVCLQETKLSHISVQDVSSFLGQEFVNFVYLPAHRWDPGGLARRNLHGGPPPSPSPLGVSSAQQQG